MDDEQNIKLSEYIKRSLKGAWELARANPNSMQFFDLTSDGFWKSFLALGVMAPVFILRAYYNMQGEGDHPIMSESIYFVISLPLTAFVMIYFTRFMKIAENYAPMVIAYNWVNAFIYCLLTIVSLALSLLLPESSGSSFMMLLLNSYFGLYVVWFMFKISLNIGGFLAAGVVLFSNLLNSVFQIILLMIFDPAIFEKIISQINNQPA
jgi:hypothetical protein